MLLVITRRLTSHITRMKLRLLRLLQRRTGIRYLTGLRTTIYKFGLTLSRIRRHQLANTILTRGAVTITHAGRPNRVNRRLLKHTINVNVTNVCISRVSGLLTRTTRNRTLRLRLIARKQRINSRLTNNVRTGLKLNKTHLNTTTRPHRLLTHRITATLLNSNDRAITLCTLRSMYQVTTLRKVSLTIISLPRTNTSLIRRPTIIHSRRRNALTTLPTNLWIAHRPISNTRVRIITKLIRRRRIMVTSRRTHRIRTATLATQGLTRHTLPKRVTSRTNRSLTHTKTQHPLMLKNITRGNVVRNVDVSRIILLTRRASHHTTTIHRTSIVKLRHTNRRTRRHQLTITIFASGAGTITLTRTRHRTVRGVLNKGL